MESDAEAPMEADVGAGDLGAVPKPRRNRVGRKQAGRKVTCSFPGCGPTSLKRHRMPNKPEIKEAWMEAMGLQSDDKAEYRVCEAHFAPDDYAPGARGRTLKPEAVPKPKDAVEAMELDTGESDAVDVAAAEDVDVAPVDVAAEDVDAVDVGTAEDVVADKDVDDIAAEYVDKRSLIKTLTDENLALKSQILELQMDACEATKKLAEKDEENARLKQQLGNLTYSENLLRVKNDELKDLRQKVHSLQTMLGSERKAMKNMKKASSKK